MRSRKVGFFVANERHGSRPVRWFGFGPLSVRTDLSMGEGISIDVLISGKSSMIEADQINGTLAINGGMAIKQNDGG